MQHVVDHRQTKPQKADHQHEGFHLPPHRIRQQQPEGVDEQPQGEDVVGMQGMGKNGRRREQHNGGETEPDHQDCAKQIPRKLGEQGLQEERESRNGKVVG